MSICTVPTPAYAGILSPVPNRPRLRFLDAGGDGSGAGGDAGDSAGGDGDSGDGDSGDGDEKLGAPGVQALERTKARLKAASADLKAYSELGLTPDEIKAIVDEKNAGKAPDEASIEKRLRKEIEADAREKTAAKFRAGAVREQAATLGFHDPKDALAFLDSDALADVDVDDNDEVDTAAVKKLLEALAQKKPHLVKNPDDDTPDWRSAGIGARGSGNKPENVLPGTPRMAAAYADSSKK
ncbi:hypothetical protein [Herbiconiux solani]|uniref:hypothetical protein n=1 Tax=Herbiconiux solani TaxID=661329 RepID=UPI000826028B|nr:hypothetical protein [Herbiconiux solani]